MAYEIQFIETFRRWAAKIKDPMASAHLTLRLNRIRGGNLGDHKAVGRGVSELRIDIGKGYRLYYTLRRKTVVLLLCGGIKDTQQQDIIKAHQLARELKQ
jgi:putative addiction module killer protein